MITADNKGNKDTWVIKGSIKLTKSVNSVKNPNYAHPINYTLTLNKRLVNTYILSIALYGCETCVINEMHKKH